VEFLVNGEFVPTWTTVVGVVRHLRHRRLSEVVREQVYVPHRQCPRNPMAWAIRSAPGGTADAAEILAAAIQDNKRGKVVGERTYGDAAQRKAITMEDGGAIILSVAKYYSPDGKAIQDTGVVPATVATESEAQVEYDDNGEPLQQSEQAQTKKTTEEDAVVKKALEVLK
jgi:hypothetical protein